MIIRFKHFHDSLNIVVILAPGCQFFSAKYGQCSLKFIECYFVNKENTVRFAYVPFDFISLYLFVLTIAMNLKDANHKSH